MSWRLAFSRAPSLRGQSLRGQSLRGQSLRGRSLRSPSPRALARPSRPPCAISRATCVILQVCLWCGVIGPAAGARAQADGLSIATLALPRDSLSAGQAVVVGQLARQGFARNPRYAVLPLERVLAFGEPPLAEQRLREALGHLERGRLAYASLEVQAALEALTEAVVAFEQATAVLTDLSPLLEALYLQGSAFQLAGDTNNARRAFERVLALDPGALFQDARIPEGAAPTIAAARKRAARQAAGTLTVYAMPAAAEVWVDGQFRGAAPLSVDHLPAGRHYVRVVHDGYQTFGESVDVGPRGEETLQASLRPTARFAEFDALVQALPAGGPGAAAAARELASLLKVEQLLWLLVEGAGDDVSVAGQLTSGITGETLSEGEKTFVFNSPRFRGDLEVWLAGQFRRTRSVKTTPSPAPSEAPRAGSFVPEKPALAMESPLVDTGRTLMWSSTLPLALGIGAGAYSLYWYDVYKNRGRIFGQDALPHQLHPEVPNVQTAYFVTSLVADVGYLGAAALLGTGLALWTAGVNHKATLEDVLAEAPPPEERGVSARAGLPSIPHAPPLPALDTGWVHQLPLGAQR